MHCVQLFILAFLLQNEQRVQTLQQTGTLKLLPPGQQQEYNELKMRLALYKRRKGKGLQMSTKAMAKGMCCIVSSMYVLYVHVHVQ